jgi:hypothetical protein
MTRLDETDVCANCGAVTWFGQMHQCRPRSSLYLLPEETR